MPMLALDGSICTACAVCASVCPSGIITLQDGGVPRYAEGEATKCILCGHCEAVCPAGALELVDRSLEQTPVLASGGYLEPDSLAAYLRMRRSVRRYRKLPVDRASIETLMKTVRYAPTGHNRRDVRWLVIFDTAELRRLTGMAIDWMRETAASGSPLAERFHMGARVAAWEQGRDSICRLAPHLVIAYVHEANPVSRTNAVIALAHLEIIAPSLGLGTCWGGIFLLALNNYQPLREALDLPSEHQPVHTMMLGYPETSYQRPPKRNKADIVWR